MLMSSENMRLCTALRQDGLAPEERGALLEQQAALSSEVRISDEALLQMLESGPPIDWQTLRRIHLPSRSTADCERQWTQCDDVRLRPFLHKMRGDNVRQDVPFSEGEAALLAELSEKHGGHSWEEVWRSGRQWRRGCGRARLRVWPFAAEGVTW
jgi:hypothetical protein